MEQVLAAVGFPSVPPPARMGVPSEVLFEEPQGVPVGKFEDVIPRVGKNGDGRGSGCGSGERGQGPLMKLPYPFTGRGAQVSSKDQVPLPPSPGGSEEKVGEGVEVGEEDGEEEEDGAEGEEGEVQEDEEGDDEEEEEGHEGSKNPPPAARQAPCPAWPPCVLALPLPIPAALTWD
jgi:hypothetical protein